MPTRRTWQARGCVPVCHCIQLTLRALQLMDYPANVMPRMLCLWDSLPSGESASDLAGRSSPNAFRRQPLPSTASKSA